MNGLTGKCVNIVLVLETGRGMGFIQNPIKITASFNDRSLESDLIQPDDCPTFNTELVWETEKRELRKVRSANCPLRIELETFNEHQRKERVGFILISPRCADIIPRNHKMGMPFKWHRVLGVAAENKIYHPEIYLSFTICDLSNKVVIDMYEEEEEEEQAENISTIGEEVFYDKELVSVQYLPDGFIQIGSDQTNETYMLSIIVQMAYNLDLLLPEKIVFSRCKEKYFIVFEMFGLLIKSKPFCRDFHANIPMNEKILFRIRSEYGMLRDYFNTDCQIIVNFHGSRGKLGMTSLSVDSFLRDITAETFLSKACSITNEQKCYFKFPSARGVIPTGTSNRKPFIEVLTNLQRIEVTSAPDSFDLRSSSAECVEAESMESINSEGTLSEVVLHDAEIYEPEECLQEVYISPKSEEGRGDGENELPKNPEKETVINQTVSEFGDHITEPEALELQEVDDDLTDNTEAVIDSEEQNPEVKELALFEINEIPETSTSDITVISHAPTLPLSPNHTIKSEEINKKINLYQQYCLDVIIENISLKKSIKSEKLRFKFKHPKASSGTMIISEFYIKDTSIGEDILLENAKCKMFFVSTDEHIRKLVYTWGPKLLLTDESDHVLTEELDLYTAMFMAKDRNECFYVTEWKSVRNYEPLAKLSISMYLQEYSLEALPEPTDMDLLPAILDEDIALKELQDLQEWKKIQTAQFSADLKILENQRFSKMQADWARKKTDLETTLSKSIDRCQGLSLELQAAVNSIRTKRALEQKENELAASKNSSLQEYVQKNLEKYANFDTTELINKLSMLEWDSHCLKEIINDQRLETKQIKINVLTKEQTTNLLQQLRVLEEKFEQAQKAKSYFKEQWKKAVQEIHDLRSEEQKQIQENIQNHKFELSQLSLDSFATVDISLENAQSPFHVSASQFQGITWNSL